MSAPLTGSVGLYSSMVTTQPGAKTRIHHHGPCETSIYIQAGLARFTFGPTGLEDTFTAEAGDFVYIPAGEVHVEENASTVHDLVVVLTRNCADSHVVYLDGGEDGGLPPAP
ncbi:MAG: cupin family protein [Chloroflexi bacterium]|nr:cupin family protein [Chloroflexota bacterium]